MITYQREQGRTVVEGENDDMLTPLAVLMGLAFSFGTSTLRYCGGTAAMMSTRRGCAESPYLAEVLVFSLKAEIPPINVPIRTSVPIPTAAPTHCFGSARWGSRWVHLICLSR